MAEIKFYANTAAVVVNTETGLWDNVEIPVADSGIGFYGSSFGVAVPVGGQQSKTYITNVTDGTEQGDELSNTAMSSVGGDIDPDTNQVINGKLLLNNSVNELDLALLPNYQCPLNIRFIHDTPATVQNAKLRIFDRTTVDTSANGVTTYVFEARHPKNTQTDHSLAHRADGANGFVWTEFMGYDPDTDELDDSAGVYMNLTDSPGEFGRNESRNAHTTTSEKAIYNVSSNEGSLWRDDRHDWYIALSSSPDSIGSKLNYGLYVTLEYL